MFGNSIRYQSCHVQDHQTGDEQLNGIIVLNKSAGCTSFEAVRAVSRLFLKEKAGHSGTLDPMATGVLPVFLGRATKLIQYLPDTDKEYIADIAFGTQTDTGDKEGKPLYTSKDRPNMVDWFAAAESFCGDQYQVPPMYSAVKMGGVPLYEMARKGQTVDRHPRLIHIYGIEVIDIKRNTSRIRVRCSAGTYIRTLAEDMAAVCGCFAHLTSLKRTKACGLSIENAVTLEELEKAENKEDYLIEPEKLFTAFPVLPLDDDLTRLFMNGFLFSVERTEYHYDPGTRVRVYNDDRFIALGEITERAELKKLWQAE